MLCAIHGYICWEAISGKPLGTLLRKSLPKASVDTKFYRVPLEYNSLETDEVNLPSDHIFTL
ncbi:predicted protein [Sclerotinia sclerotiorum 1980 UF-70]|uniref:Uncharacterized protein n=2 Tax=Sclerotinia sclerotiorum (strain ATCC 18683 / 1980 / Ss-1) TaxID=665079 RepID=A7ED54_SCLS1|nr:predicted protein [Sclerotinia sclerotiorum 1980 UF-70]APA11039.1 hypothetical protein sscle_07g058090 [Sclerotinia sclerotiorum 1980 UF-70]EDO00770.1 predicted protein [Sclerotinia sclerotiorum 1980 UF-70]